jgi:hypothetical protein
MTKLTGLINWTSESELKAFDEGAGNYWEGLDMEDCPWLDATREAVAWKDGWNAAERKAIAEIEAEREESDMFEVDEESEEDRETDF